MNEDNQVDNLIDNNNNEPKLNDNIENKDEIEDIGNTSDIPEIVYIPDKEEKKMKRSKIRVYIDDFIAKLNKFPKITKIYIIICLTLTFLNSWIKKFLAFKLWSINISSFSDFKEIYQDIIGNGFFAKFLYIFDIIYLFLGLIFLVLHSFAEGYIRAKFIWNPLNRSLNYFFLIKIIYFVSMGLVSETVLIGYPFANKNNIVVYLYKYKVYSQPLIFIIIVIAIVNFVRSLLKKDDKIHAIKKKQRKVNNLIKTAFQNKALAWNNFSQTNVKHDIENKEETRDESSLDNSQIQNQLDNDDEEDANYVSEDSKSQSDISNKLSDTESPIEPNDENNQENNGEAKKNKVNYIKKFLDILYTFIPKAYVKLGMFIFCVSPFIFNGVFTYGYYVFAFEDSSIMCFLYKMDLVLMVVLAIILSRMTE